MWAAVKTQRAQVREEHRPPGRMSRTKTPTELSGVPEGCARLSAAHTCLGVSTHFCAGGAGELTPVDKPLFPKCQLDETSALFSLEKQVGPVDPFNSSSYNSGR